MTLWLIRFILFTLQMNPYELARIVRDVVNYQQNEISTYKIIVTIETIVIILLSCEIAGRHLLG